MKELLIRLVRQATSGSMYVVDAVALDKVMRLYHKEAAKARGFNTKMGGRFMQFGDEFPQVELQRGAVDIVKEMATANTSGTLPDLFKDALNDLLIKLQK